MINFFMRIDHQIIYFIVLVLIVQLSSCISYDSQPSIDSEFQIYVDKFFEEAAIRNLDFDPSKDELNISFGHDNPTHGGICKHSSNQILINEFYWKDYTEIGKERLIFHEIGHCLLDRPHNNEVLPNGDCKSLMKGTEQNTCRKNLGESKIWNKYYIDELFDKETPLPDWYVTQFDKGVTENIIDSNLISSNYFSLSLSELDTSQNFKLTAIYQDWQPNTEIRLSIGKYDLIVSKTIVNLTNEKLGSIYYNRHWKISNSTSITIAHSEGIDYLIIDNKMFHIDQLDTDYKNIVMSTKGNPNIKDINIEFNLSILTD